MHGLGMPPFGINQALLYCSLLDRQSLLFDFKPSTKGNFPSHSHSAYNVMDGFLVPALSQFQGTSAAVFVK